MGILVKMFKGLCRPNKIHSYRPSAAHMGLRPCKMMEDQRSILNRMYGIDRLSHISAGLSGHNAGGGCRSSSLKGEEPGNSSLRREENRDEEMGLL